jgi:hypothetical protein
MAKMQLVEIVKDILSDMGSDVVSSIGDTAESDRVAAIVKSTYFKMIEEKNWPHLMNTIQLVGLGDTTKPSHMQIPTTTRYLEWIKHNNKIDAADPDAFTDIEHLYPKAFLDRINSRDSTDSSVQVVTDTTGVTLNIRNDVAPSAWTSFDDEYIVFDSFDSAIGSTLVSAKTQCFGYEEPVWTGGDTFVPALPANKFPLFLSTAKAQCFNKIKQVVDAQEERDATRQRVVMQKAEHLFRQNGGKQKYGYGRK